MKENIIISIVIPVYNMEKYLRECLESVCNQTFNNIEIIIVNDGSIDNSKIIIEEYLEKDSRIVFIDKENTGLSDSRNIGLKNARGKYILFLDSDDYLNKNCCKTLYNEMEQENIDLLRLNYNIIYKDEFIKKNISYKKMGKKIFRLNEYIKNMNKKNLYNFNVWSYLFKKEIIENNCIKFDKELHIGEDDIFTIEYLNYCQKIKVLDKNLYFYRIREGSSTNTASLLKIRNLILVLEKMKKVLINTNISYENQEYILQRYCAIILFFISKLIKKDIKVIKNIVKKELIKMNISRNLHFKYKYTLLFAKFNLDLLFVIFKLRKKMKR